jgi:hypothetical protein
MVTSAASPNKKNIEGSIIKVPPDKKGKLKSPFDANVRQELQVFTSIGSAEEALQLSIQPVQLKSKLNLAPPYILIRWIFENFLKEGPELHKWSEHLAFQDDKGVKYKNSVLHLPEFVLGSSITIVVSTMVVEKIMAKAVPRSTDYYGDHIVLLLQRYHSTLTDLASVNGHECQIVNTNPLSVLIIFNCANPPFLFATEFLFPHITLSWVFHYI